MKALSSQETRASGPLGPTWLKRRGTVPAPGDTFASQSNMATINVHGLLTNIIISIIIFS